MSIKWNDTTERMMLVKFLEQNLAARLDVDTALAAWPKNLAKPTKRSLGDRFAGLKRQIKQRNLTSTLGIGSSIAAHATNDAETSASPAVPKTPRSLSSKRAKTNNDQVAGPASCPPLAARPANSDAVKSTSSGRFRTKLQAAAKISKKRKRNGKGKGRGGESDEESMSSHDSDSETNAIRPDSNTPGSRRSLPRRSKSMTPGTSYQVDDDARSQTEAEAELVDEEQDTGRVIGRKAKGKSAQDSDDESDVEHKEEDHSDDRFNPFAQDNEDQEHHGSKKKRKLTWRERIARLDGGNVDEDEDDMQD